MSDTASRISQQMEAIARTLLGEANPRLSSDHELRFGTRGSMSVDLAKGTWFDHERGFGGGMFDLIKDQTGVDGRDWIERHGLEIRRTHPAPRKANGKAAPLGKKVATYTYRDEAGALLFEVVRYEPKDFRPRRPDPDKPGNWIWSIKGVRQVPYRLPELQEQLSLNHTVVVVEGEKDADALWSIGAPATCNAGGAGKWTTALNAFFHDADIIIIPDHDSQTRNPKTGAPMFHSDGRPVLPGQDHAEAVACQLAGVAARVRILDLATFWPDMPPKADISDWLSLGHSRAELDAMIHQAVEYRASDVRSKTDADAGAAQQSDSDPVDLWGNFEPPTLQRGLLPKLIEKYAFAQAETMGVDPGGVAMAALAVCAAAIPDSIKLMMKRYSGEWMEPARLWVGLVGLPSTKKSPIISATIKPLARLDAELLREFLLELQRYELMEKENRKKVSKPAQKRLRLEDTTIEGAQEVLAGSPNGVLLVQDELSGFFGSMDKYSGHRGGAKDRGFWLQSYNGGPYALNRVGRGAAIIPNLSVSLLGGVQPDVIRRLSSESYDDGFLQRMLLIMMRPAVLGKDVSMPSVSKDYAKLIERLTELRLPVSGSSNDDDDGVLRFDNLAQELRSKLEAEHLKLMQIEAINRKLAAHIGKYDGLFGRLCVAFHCIEHAHDSFIPEFVTEDTAKRVASFMRQFLLPHATAFYSGVLKLADDHDRLAAIAGYILARRSERITNRDIQRGDRTMRKLTRHDTESAFEQLEALGWVTKTPGPRLTDPPHWNVNPIVHEKFAARAKDERARREATVMLMKGLSG
jgi:hypothetical protein